MNIHGYKQSKKRMGQSLKYELSKPIREQNTSKIRRLQIAITDCGKIIKKLKEQRDVSKGKKI